jgi:hypothetical protein
LHFIKEISTPFYSNACWLTFADLSDRRCAWIFAAAPIT